MPRIEYPDVPIVAGVPALLRLPDATPANAADDVVNILAGNVLQQLFLSKKWGIFKNGKNVMELNSSNDVLGSVAAAVVGGAVVSTAGVRYGKDWQISGFPIEGGRFAAYNKVELPADPRISINMSGNESQRATFLTNLEKIAGSLDLYDIVLPEKTYIGYSITSYDYDRRQQRGAGMISVDIRLREIRTVTATFLQSTSKAKQPTAKPPVSNGKVQGSVNTKLPTVLQGKLQ